jgi:hypothetical protein
MILISYQSDTIKDKCYECGGNVTTEWGYALDAPLVAPLAKQYYIKCEQCGLHTTYTPGTTAQNEPYELGKSAARCAAAWKAWFRHHMEAILEGGQYPRWIRNN